MGLKKRISQPNGVSLNYHRVVSVTTVTNSQTVIEVAGYTSKAKRLEEKSAAEAVARGEEASCDVYIATSYVEAPYQPEMGVIGAYGYLKTLPEFEGATDVLEIDQPEEAEQETEAADAVEEEAADGE